MIDVRKETSPGRAEEMGGGGGRGAAGDKGEEEQKEDKEDYVIG